MQPRHEVFPHVIELNYQARRRLGPSFGSRHSLLLDPLGQLYDLAALRARYATDIVPGTTNVVVPSRFVGSGSYSMTMTPWRPAAPAEAAPPPDDEPPPPDETAPPPPAPRPARTSITPPT